MKPTKLISRTKYYKLLLYKSCLLGHNNDFKSVKIQTSTVFIDRVNYVLYHMYTFIIKEIDYKIFSCTRFPNHNYEFKVFQAID